MGKRLNLILLIGALAAFGAGCARAKPKAEQDAAAPQSSPTAPVYGPESPANSEDPQVSDATGQPLEPQAPQPSYGPKKIQTKPVVIISGPGMARAFALAGVLRGLEDAKIPIKAIYATEMSGLIAGMYTMSRSINQFEFLLLKLKDDLFAPKQVLGFLKPTENDGMELKNELEKMFGSRDFSEGRVPVKIGVTDRNGQFFYLDRGPAVEILRASCSIPGYFEKVETMGLGEVSSGSQGVSLSVSDAGKDQSNPILVLDWGLPKPKGHEKVKITDELKNYLTQVFSQKSSDEMNALKESHILLRPDLTLVDPLDFSKRAEAMYRGKNLIKERLKEIQKKTQADL